MATQDGVNLRLRVLITAKPLSGWPPLCLNQRRFEFIDLGISVPGETSPKALQQGWLDSLIRFKCVPQLAGGTGSGGMADYSAHGPILLRACPATPGDPVVARCAWTCECGSDINPTSFPAGKLRHVVDQVVKLGSREPQNAAFNGSAL